MDMTGSQTLPVAQQIAWDALNDADMLKKSIPGCDELTRTSDTEFSAVVNAVLGPVKARFKAKLTLCDVDAPNTYTIRFDGQGGVAGFGKGEARVTLSPEGPHTRLDYAAKANVGGKLAQIGSRLVDAAARKLAEEFFAKFTAELASRHPVMETPSGIEPAAQPPAAPMRTDNGITWWRRLTDWLVGLFRLRSET